MSRKTQIRPVAIAGILLGLALCGQFAGCYADIHDNTADVDADFDIKDAKLEFDIDGNLDEVEQGQSLSVNINAENVFLVAPSATPPPDQAVRSGHFQFYLDNTTSEPILITAELNVSVVIPAAEPAGDHKLICRSHKHDGTPTEATFEVDIKVKVKVVAGAAG